MDNLKRSDSMPTSFFPPGTYDLFITHAWRYTDEWQQMVGLLDDYLPGKWRNWSIPWHDTSIDRYSDEGKDKLTQLLSGHISMSSAIILLPELIRTSGGEIWLDIQLTIAGQLVKPVIGVLPLDRGRFSVALRDKVKEIVPRDAAQIVRAVERLSAHPK